MEPFTILLLAVLNFFLSFISVIVGGGALIMVPLLISMGVPVQNTVAITRFYNLGTGGASLFKFNRGGKVSWRIGLPLAAVAAVGSIFGANMVLSMNEILLKNIIAVIIIFVLGIMVFNRKIGTKTGNPGKLKMSIGYALTFLVIFISTLIGGGSGTMTSYILIFFFGETFIQSMGTRKILAMSGLIFSSIFFVMAGLVLFEIAIPLLITGALGGYMGARFAMKRGEKWVRIFFIAIAFIMALFLFFQM